MTTITMEKTPLSELKAAASKESNEGNIVKNSASSPSIFESLMISSCGESQDVAQTILEDFYFLDSVKEYNHSKRYRKEKYLQDKGQSWEEVLKKKNKKKAKKLSRRGRTKMENHSVSDLTSFEYHKKVLSMFGTNMSERADLMNIVSIQLAYIAALLTVESSAQFLTATTQMLVSVVCGTDLIDIESLKDIWIKNSIEDQSLETMRSALERFRQGFIALESVPMWQQISRAFTLAAMVGFLPSKIEGDTTGLLTMGLNTWTKSLHIIASKTSVFDLILDSTIFACDFCNAVKTGTIKHLFSPDDVTLRATWILAHTEAYLNGMLPEGENEEVFLAKVHKCVDDINILISNSPYSGMLLVLNKFRSQLVTFLSQAEALASIADLRPAAPIIYLYGASQIGKSGLMNAIAIAIGKNNGFPVEQENFHYMSIGDKYDSGYTGIKTVIFQDDCAAEHPKYRDATNVTSDIKHSNTVPYYSVQADISGKGKIPFRHFLKIKSGNTMDGGLLNDLSYPLAGTNRIDFFQVTLKKEYADQQGRYKAKSDSDYLDPNIHEITPYWYTNHNVNGMVKIGAVYGTPMSTPEFLRHVDKLYKSKMAGGKKYVAQINNMRTLDMCPTCHVFKAPGYCSCKEMEDQFGMAEVADICMNTFVVQLLARLPDLPNNLAGAFLYRHVFAFLNNIGSRLMTMFLLLCRVFLGSHIITTWFSIPILINFMVLFRVHFDVMSVHIDHWFLVFGLVAWLFFTWCFMRRLRDIYTHYLARELMNSTTSVVSIGLRVASFGVVISAAFMALWRMKGLLKFENQGNLLPKSKEDIEERAREVNPWVDVQSEEIIERKDSVSTMTHTQVLSVVSRNIVRVDCFNQNALVVSSTGLMICNNILIFPTHALSAVKESTELIIKRNHSLGGVIKGIRFTKRYDMPNDFSLLVLTKAPSFRNILDFFPDNVYTGGGSAIMLIRDANLEMDSISLPYKYIKRAYNASHTCEGSMSRSNKPVYKGMCGSPVIMESCPSKIVSLHCGGGLEVKNFAASFSISKKMIEDGLAAVSSMRMESHAFPGDRPFIGSGLNLDPYGDTILNIDKDLHERDCVLYTYPSTEENDYCITVHGCDKAHRSKPFSLVRISPLAPLLEKYDRKRNYGPTPFKADRNYSAAWQVITDGGVYIPQNLLALASEDYLDGLSEEIDRLSMKAKPLTMTESINGIPGSRFVKRLDMKTSPGPGLKSPKAIHFKNVALDSDRPEYICEDYLLESIAWVENELSQGRVPEMLSKTALKDEPTKLTKDKVRVFCACSLPLNIVIRKYLLPILNNLYYIPFASEMAQGINCTTDEWHQLGVHIREYGEETCIAGDFSGYDSRQTGQIQRVTAWLFSQMAIKMGYSYADADKVELLVMSLSAKYVLWNGTLVHMDGFMLSGSPVTIAINGVDNALYHRIAYFHELTFSKRVAQGTFKDNVRMMFVGDDSIGSTRLLWYNMTTLQRIFTQYGIKYTDAQKNLVASEFVNFKDMDFCKRNFRYEERVEGFVAPIKIDSIYKSLFCYRESNTAVKDIIISVLRGASRELARHTELVFEREIAILRQVSIEYEIDHMVEELFFTYDYWWREVFAKDYDCYLNQDIDSFSVSGSVSSMDSLD